MKKKVSLILVVLLLPLSFCSLKGQVSLEKKIDIGYSVQGCSIIPQPDDSYLISGYTYADSNLQSSFPFIVTVDKNGSVIKSRTFASNFSNGITRAILTHDGGFAVVASTVVSSVIKATLIKFDHDWNEQWATAIGTNITYTGTALIETFDHGFAFSAFVSNSGISLVTKVDSLGKTLWITGTEQGQGNTFSGGMYVCDLVECSDSCIVVGGYASSGTNNIELDKLSPDGHVIWVRRDEGNASSLGFSLIRTADDGLVICGALDQNDDFFAEKFDSQGNLIWNSSIDAFANSIGLAMTEASNGDLLASGMFNSKGNFSGSDSLMLVRLDHDGNFKSFKFLTIPNASSIGWAITSTSAGIAVAGTITLHPPTQTDKGQGRSLLFAKFSEESDLCHTSDGLVSQASPNKNHSSVFSLIGTSDIKLTPVIIGVTKDVPFIESDLCSLSEVSESVTSAVPFSIHPNPASRREMETIHYYNALASGKYELRISDLLGKTLLSKNIQKAEGTGDIPFSISQLMCGSYIVELHSKSSGNIIYSAKLIVAD